MASHEGDSIEDLARTGMALHNWFSVLYEDKPIASCDDTEAMRELTHMKDTDNNRDLLIVAASRIGLPEATVNVLNEWVNADRVKSDRFPADQGFFSSSVHDRMEIELAKLATE